MTHGFVFILRFDFIVSNSVLSYQIQLTSFVITYDFGIHRDLANQSLATQKHQMATHAANVRNARSINKYPSSSFTGNGLNGFNELNQGFYSTVVPHHKQISFWTNDKFIFYH